MESYISAVYPLFFAFRIFGVKFESIVSSKCTRLQLLISRCLHYLSTTLFLITVWHDTFQQQKNLIEAFRYVMYVISSIQMIAGRVTFDLSIRSYVQMFNKTGEIMREFNGKEKLFLKKLKLLIRCLCFFPLHGFIQFCFNASQTYGNFFQYYHNLKSKSPTTVFLMFGFFFYSLPFMENQSFSSIGFMVEAVATISVEITLAGLVNKMVVKSLSTLYHLVNCKLPFRKSNKLLIKLDLYSAHVEVWKPFLTIGFLSHVTSSSVIPVLDFILTYLMFACELRNQWSE
ncbi:hypothetical protein CHUAL_008531 [Chamberlinius hualienensis]